MTSQESSRKPINRFKVRIYGILKLVVEKIQLINFLNRQSPLKSENLFRKRVATCELDIVTIAYNHPQMTALQIQLIRKNLQDPFTHIVADNSSDPVQAQKIPGPQSVIWNTNCYNVIFNYYIVI